MDNRPIGFLDSGVGGLTVVRELLRQLLTKMSSILEIQRVHLMVLDQQTKFASILGRW